MYNALMTDHYHNSICLLQMHGYGPCASLVLDAGFKSYLGQRLLCVIVHGRTFLCHLLCFSLKVADDECCKSCNLGKYKTELHQCVAKTWVLTFTTKEKCLTYSERNWYSLLL